MGRNQAGNRAIPSSPTMAACPPQALRQESEPVRWTVGSYIEPMQMQMQCPIAVCTTESNSNSLEVCGTPRGTTNPGSPNTTEQKSPGGEGGD